MIEDSFQSISHARCRSQRRQDRTRNRYNDLRDELYSFFLAHNDKGLIVKHVRESCGGGLAPRMRINHRLRDGRCRD